MASQDSWTGWIVFAGFVIIIVGVMDALQGFIAILEDEYVVATPKGLAIFDVTAWGWTSLIWGGLACPRRARPARRGRLGTLARDLRRRHQRDPAGRVPGELPAGISAVEHPDRRAQLRRALRTDGALAGLPGLGEGTAA